jgi:hypothetical protein
MNDTGINIVAVTIFSLVALSLVGPAVHLSPTIPAIAAFGIVGLASFDNFFLKGTFGTIFVDWIAGFSEAYRDRVLRHEAGHFLVAHLVEIPITGYSLTALEAFRQQQPGLGCVTFDTDALEQEIAQGKLSVQTVDRYAKVWMAGIAAEELLYKTAEGGIDDRQKLRFLWSALKRPMAEADQKERWSKLQAKNLLSANEAAYQALVEKMKERASVAECYEAIAQAKSSVKTNGQEVTTSV